MITRSSGTQLWIYLIFVLFCSICTQIESFSYYQITQLTSNNVQFWNASAQVGHYGTANLVIRGNNNYIYGGLSDLVSSLNRNQLDTILDSIAGAGKLMLFNDLQARKVYAARDEQGQRITEPGFIQSIEQINPRWTPLPTQLESVENITLSEVVWLGYSSLACSGRGEAVLVDGDSGTANLIDLITGQVTQFMNTLSLWQLSQGWISYGVMEYLANGQRSIVYGNVYGGIERQQLTMVHERANLTALRFNHLSSLTVDWSNSKWLFYFRGNSLIGSSFPTTIGFADLTYTDGTATSNPTTRPTDNPTRSPTAVLTMEPSIISTYAPSIAPTFLPTIAQTLSPVAPTVPVLLLLSSTSFATNIVLTFALEGSTSLAGTVYCAPSSTSSVSVEFIQQFGSSADYDAQATNISINVQNLVPLSSPQIFCAVVTSDGLASSPGDIQSTPVVSNTTCCKTVRFGDTPAMIYSDVARYKSRSKVGYTANYQLDFAPFLDVVVKPVIMDAYNNIVSESVIKLLPPSRSFFANSKSLDAKFIVLASDPLLSGEFTISFTLSGSSSSEYVVEEHSVRMVGSNEEPLTPNLAKVVYSDGGTELNFNFDYDTNLAYLPLLSPWACNEVFAFPGSEYVTCTWLNKKAIVGKIAFGVNDTALVDVDDVVRVHPDTVQASCAVGNLTLCEQYRYSNSSKAVLVQKPVNPITPTVIMQYSSTLGQCQDLIIDSQLSTGNAGRLWKEVYWVVVSTSTSSSVAIQQELDAFGRDIAHPITIPRSVFTTGEYSITLIVKNVFGKMALKQINVEVVDDPYLPKVSILGDTNIRMDASELLTLYSRAIFAKCSNDSVGLTLTYSWDVVNHQSGELLRNVTNLSRNPAIFIMAPYSLMARSVYDLQLNVTVWNSSQLVSSQLTTSTLQTSAGKLTAVISGGAVVQLPMDQEVTLNGTESFDTETMSKAHLLYQWACEVSSNNRYGEACNEVFVSNAHNVTVMIAGYMLDATTSYSISLWVISLDGRSHVTAIDLYPIAAQSPTVTVSATNAKFNLDTSFSLQGYVHSNVSALHLSWKAFVSEDGYAFTSQSPVLKEIDRNLASTGFRFPLVVLGSSFVAGSKITFRLEAALSDQTALHSYSEVEVMANSAPYGGKLRVTPTQGYELSTKFTIQSFMWIDDPEDYPLTFTFFYKMYSEQSALSLQGESTTSSTTALLPAGSSSLEYHIQLISVVKDRYDASNEASTTVEVLSSDVIAADYLESSMQEAFSSYNSDQAQQAVSNMVNIYNKVNCSLATASFCDSLHRKACTNVPNTCGVCLEGFEGVTGSMNLPCTAVNVVPRRSLKTKVTSVKECPSNTQDVCSGQGVCVYQDANGIALTSACSDSNVYCQAVCKCFDGYGGTACSLSAAELSQRDFGRSQLCNHLQGIYNMSNISPELLLSYSNALSQIYQPSEFSNDTSVSKCQDSLALLSALLTSDVLRKSSTEVKTAALQAISAFIVPGAMQNFTIDELLQTFISQHLDTITLGQYPVNITSSNMVLSMQKTSASDLRNSTVSVPFFTDVSQQGLMSSSIEFSPDADLSLCTKDGEDSTALSLTQFNANPLSGTFDIDSPVLRWVLFSGKDVNMTQSQLQTTQNISSESSSVAYYVSMQFLTEQSFDFTHSLEEAKQLQLSNFTFPECSSFDGQAFTSCGGCVLSSFTNHNVTYACYDMSEMCGLFLPDPVVVVDDVNRTVDSNATVTSGRRRLVQETLKTRATQLSSFVVALESHFVYVLSANPFHVDLEEAKAIISFIGIFALILVSVGVFFFRWDQSDRNQFIYTNRWPPKISVVNAAAPLLGKKKSKYIQELEAQQNAVALEEDHDNEVVDTKPTRSKSIFSLSMSWDPEDHHHRSSSRSLASPTGSTSAKMSPQRPQSERRQLSHAKTSTSSTRKKLVFQHKIFASNVQGFFDLIMPGILEHNYVMSYLHALLIKHDFTTPIIHPSTSSGRFYRWLSICKSLLVGLFVDTLFFQIFYANDGHCEQFQSTDSCLDGIHSITLEKVCTWNSITQCDTVGNGLLSTDSACTISTSCSLAPPPTSAYFTLFLAASTLLLCIPIEIAISYLLDQYCAKRPNLDLIGINSGYWLGGWIGYQDRLNAKEMVAQSKLADIFAAAEKQALRSFPQNEAMKKLLEEIMLRTSDRVYRDYQTVEEELMKIVLEVKEHFEEGRARYMPMSSVEQDAWKEAHDARTEAILQQLGIRSDGSYFPLSLREQLFYFKHPRDRLLAKLLLVRQQTDIIGERVEIIGPMSKHLQEVTLLNHFVLEQFSSFKQWILNDQFYCFGELRPSLIDPIDWMAAWLFVSASMLFFFYWILAWGIRNGDKVLYHWGVNFIVSTLQDIFLIQVGKIFIIHLVLIVSIRPQLAAIQLHLRGMAMDYIQGVVPLRKQIRLNDFSIVHFISPLCRYSWRESCDELAMGRILRQMDDLDIKKCHAYPKQPLGWLSLLLFMLPGIVVLFGGKVAEVLIETVLPMLVAAVLLVHVELYNISIFALCIPYVLLILYILHYVGFTRLVVTTGKQWKIRIRNTFSVQSVNNASIRQTSTKRINANPNQAYDGNGVNPVVLMLMAERRKASAASKFWLSFVKDSLRFLRQFGDRHSAPVQRHEFVLWHLMNLPNTLQVQTSAFGEDASSNKTGKPKNVFFSLIQQQKAKEIQPFQSPGLPRQISISSVATDNSPNTPKTVAARRNIPLTCFSFDPNYDVNNADDDFSGSSPTRSSHVRSPTKLVKYMLFQQGNIASESQLMTLLRQKEVANQFHIPPAILALRNSKWYDIIEGNDRSLYNYSEYLLQKYFLQTPTERELYQEKIVARERTTIASDEIEEDEDSKLQINVDDDEEEDLSVYDAGYSDVESFHSFTMEKEYSMKVPYSKVPKFTPLSRRQTLDPDELEQQQARYPDATPTLATQYIDRYQICKPKLDEGVRQLLAVYMHLFNPLKDDFFVDFEESNSSIAHSLCFSASIDSNSHKHQSDSGYEGDRDVLSKKPLPLKRKMSYDLSEYLLREELTIEALINKCRAQLLTVDQASVLLKNVFSSYSPLMARQASLPLTKSQVTDFIATFCIWITTQDTATYTSKALRELQAWNASRHQEEDLFDVKTEAGRRYALLLRDSPAQNAHKVFPFHLLLSFFENKCYEMIAEHRLKIYGGVQPKKANTRTAPVKKSSAFQFFTGSKSRDDHDLSKPPKASNGVTNAVVHKSSSWGRSLDLYDTVFDSFIDPEQMNSLPSDRENVDSDAPRDLDDQFLDADFYGYFHTTEPLKP